MPPHPRAMLLLATACHPALPEEERRRRVQRAVGDGGMIEPWLDRALRGGEPVGPEIALRALTRYGTFASQDVEEEGFAASPPSTTTANVARWVIVVVAVVVAVGIFLVVGTLMRPS